MPKKTGKKFQCQMKCQCGSDKFRMVYTDVASTQQDFIITATMCHRGSGWDLSWFDPVCAECGSKGNPKFEVSEVSGKAGK